ncbi:lipocalin family protein [Pedobacter sp.]
MGNSTKYMWILSRTKTIPDAVKADYLQQAKAIGVDIDALVYNKHDKD